MIIRLLYFFYRAFRKSERILNYRLAISVGMKVGKNSLFVGMQHFGTEPYLIEFGKNCLITDGVRFITHDGSIQVPLIRKGEDFYNVYSKKSTFGTIKIGNNVFIGVSSIILPNTLIGDNSIIAAGSVVKGSFPEGCVIGGNPAKIICSIDDYLIKNEKAIIDLSSLFLDDRVNLIKNKCKVY